MRRQLIRALIASVMICAILTVPAYAETAVITGSKVNLRAGPGTNYYIAAVIDRGSYVEVKNRSDPSWYYVSYNGIEGFVSSAYLSLTDANEAVVTIPKQETVQPINETNARKCYINANYVRFRSGPGESYSIVGEYSTGKEINVVTTVGDWIAGYIDGNPGYVHKQYVTVGSLAATTVQPSQTETGGITVVSPAEISPSFDLPSPIGGMEVGGIRVLSPAPTPTPSPELNVFIVPSPEVTATPAPAAAEQTAAVQPESIKPVNADGVMAYVYGTYVRFRTGPGTNYSIIGTYNSGKEVTAYANSGNGWIFCSIEGHEGYIHGDYLYVVPTAAVSPVQGTAPVAEQQSITVIDAPVATQQPAATQQTGAYIIGNNVRFRAAPSMTSKILGELFYGNQVVLTGYVDGWAQIVYGSDVGYVYADYVREGTYGAAETPVSVPAQGYGRVTGQDIVNFASQYLGARYCWGGTSPETGFDCSGFVYYVFSHFGISVNRVAGDQALNGVHVDRAELMPGDILCFYSGSSYIGHAGIYIGNNKFIHSSNSTTGVIISDLSGYYSTRGFEARRLV